MALIRCLGWAFAELARPIAVSDNTPPLAAASSALHSAYRRAVWTNFNDGDSQRRKMLTARMGFSLRVFANPEDQKSVRAATYFSEVIDLPRKVPRIRGDSSDPDPYFPVSRFPFPVACWAVSGLSWWQPSRSDAG